MFMPTKTRLEEDTLYAGPTIGFYNSEKFRDFARIDVPLLLDREGLSPSCSIRGSIVNGGEAHVTNYSYPSLNVSLEYLHIPKTNRCMVKIQSDDIEGEVASKIVELIFENDAGNS